MNKNAALLLAFVASVAVAAAVAFVHAGRVSPPLIWSAAFSDEAALWLMILLPPLYVARWGLYGVALGAVVFWGVGAAIGMLLQRLDPTRDMALSDGLFLYLGIPIGAAYCLLVYGVRQLILGVRRFTILRREFNARHG
jgi:hypothetical protein